MAASYVNVDKEIEQERHHQHHQRSQAQSPRSLRRSCSSNSAASGVGTCGHGAAPKCVCAPATHARSFKCRLHRVSSHVGPAAPSAPMPPPPPVTSTSTRTVEAQ